MKEILDSEEAISALKDVLYFTSSALEKMQNKEVKDSKEWRKLNHLLKSIENVLENTAGFSE
ncbi:MAG: hypothetical protein WC523_03960 [Patescibacteria group bacterium]